LEEKQNPVLEEKQNPVVEEKQNFFIGPLNSLA
jgi:hypothetical protein